MRRVVAGLTLACAAVALLAGCAGPDEKALVTLTDKTGVVEPRQVTVGYVNDRLEHMPPHLLPTTGGEEGKRQFLEEIVRKELMVIEGLRQGFDEDPRADLARESFRTSKAAAMLKRDVIEQPSQVTPQEVEDYYNVRDVSFVLAEIVVQSEEEAREAYRRVTEGGEEFAEVAADMSTTSTAPQGGRRPVETWRDMHPLMRVAIRDLEKDEITEPFKINTTWYVLKILSRKQPAERKPLEGLHLTGIEVEAKSFKRDILEHEVITTWMDETNLTFDDEGLALAAERVQEKVDELLPPHEGQMTTEIAIQRAKTKIVPEFTEEEAAHPFVSFKVGPDEYNWTLGDYAQVLEESDAMETPKRGDALVLQGDVRKRVFDMVKEHQIEKRGYHTSQEMTDHIEKSLEEFMVEMVYTTEVAEKIEQPTGQEVRDYFRANRDLFVRPPRADIRQLVVADEATANLLRQRIVEGGEDFVELIRKHSIEDWSREKDGVITDILKGEKRLEYLQEPAFSQEIGVISEPLRAPGGYALVQVLERYPEEQLGFDKVGNVARESIVNERREARLLEFLDELENSVEIEYHEENFQYMKDPVEVYEEMEENKMRVTTGG